MQKMRIIAILSVFSILTLIELVFIINKIIELLWGIIEKPIIMK